jgi:hypothetical protein
LEGQPTTPFFWNREIFKTRDFLQFAIGQLVNAERVFGQIFVFYLFPPQCLEGIEGRFYLENQPLGIIAELRFTAAREYQRRSRSGIPQVKCCIALANRRLRPHSPLTVVGEFLLLYFAPSVDIGVVERLFVLRKQEARKKEKKRKEEGVFHV